jgi:hypothetical protein
MHSDFLVAAKIKKKDEHSYPKVTKKKRVPNLVRIPPLQNHWTWILRAVAYHSHGSGASTAQPFHVNLHACKPSGRSS